MLLSGLLISLSLNILLFIIAFKRQTDKLTDFSYSLSFILVTALSYMLSDNRSLAFALATAAVLAWALRLGAFLVIRIRKFGKDSRFDEMRSDFFRFLKFWVGQAVVVWILLLPLLFMAEKPSSELSLVTILGLLGFCFALVIETMADLQKFRFKLDPSNKGKWIDSGLWKYSRHPNYFGEILVWVCIFIAALPSLQGIEILIGLLSPLVIFLTLYFVSGIPPLEKYADSQWGSNKDYQAYKKRTSLLVPLWPRK